MKSFILCFLIFSASLSAQNPGRLLGIVRQADTNDAVANVKISIAGTALETFSNEKGAYLIQDVPFGTYSVAFSSENFPADTVHDVLILPGKAKRLDVALKPVVSPEAAKLEANRLWTIESGATQPGVQQINPNAVENIAGGLNDLTRVVNLLTGVTGSGDYTADYAVRGGALDQNVVYLDGIMIPNPYRMRLLLGGGFNLFNPSTIENADFYTSHFNGQYGNFLSSVMSLSSRDGRRDRFGAAGSIDFVQANLVLEGPLTQRGSWLLSTRRSYVDIFAEPYVDQQTTVPYMYDIDGKLVYDVTKDITLSYKLLHAGEATKMITQTEQDIEMKESSNLNFHMLGFESRLSDRVRTSLHAALYDEDFNYDLYADKSDPLASYGNYKSTLSSVNLHQKLAVDINDKHSLVQGVYAASEKSKLDLETNVVDINFSRRDIPPDMLFDDNSGHIAAYVDYSAKFFPKTETTLGLRYDYSELIKQNDLSAKLGFVYFIEPKMKAHAFVGKVHEYPSAMSVFTRDLPINLSGDLEDLDSESATHVVLGLDRDWQYDFYSRAEIYYKAYDHLLLPRDRVTYDPENSGEGYAYGFELTLEKAKGTGGIFSGLISYSFGKSEYRDRHDKTWVPFNYDRRHGLTAMGDVRFHRKWGANAVLRLNSGLPYNKIYGYTWHVPNQSRYVKSEFNDSRYPNYSRVDVRLYYNNVMKSSRLTVYLDLLNVFNKKNVYERMYYVLDDEPQEGPTTQFFKRATIYSMPFIPSLGLSLTY